METCKESFLRFIFNKSLCLTIYVLTFFFSRSHSVSFKGMLAEKILVLILDAYREALKKVLLVFFPPFCCPASDVLNLSLTGKTFEVVDVAF